MPGMRTIPESAVGARRRRSWSREQKQAIVAEIDVGGATLSEVARRHGVHTNVLVRWRQTLGAAPAASARARGATTAPAMSFVPVVLPAPSPSTVPSMRSDSIEIVLGGGRTVRVGADVDTTALVRIVEALEARR